MKLGSFFKIFQDNERVLCSQIIILAVNEIGILLQADRKDDRNFILVELNQSVSSDLENANDFSIFIVL